ncbi:MAG TPA: protein kinase [Bryobacteraceae bacterium]|nr:protein kinase [Bryobacteraceae bacterium]
MSLAAGTRLGSYEILAPLGAGGMGEVYRARDARLNRDVAIKTLPPAFAGDSNRMARFQREAQALAALNHPNIASIYGLEESGGVRALVMELVEGPTLAERLAGGPIAIPEALAIARQIADALEAAHDKGIIHRDLKPANIKFTADGKLKVLDFGLAKAFDADAASGNLANSPTLTLEATRAGVILGTAAYMSPEQARGKAVDKRADIWAFGVVLLEMLTGKSAFEGETVSDTLAAVLRADVDWSQLPADTPPKVRRLLQRCLERDVKRRLRDIGDAWIEIDAPEEPVAPAPPVSEPVARGRMWWLPWAAAVLIGGAGLGWGLLHRPPREPRTVVRWSYSQKGFFGAPVLSRDGTRLTTTDQVDGKYSLSLRMMDQLEGKPIPGTDDFVLGDFSPDGQWIASFARAERKLKKIPATGGTPITLADAAPFGATWGDDGYIVFSDGKGLMRVSSSGGTPQKLTTPDAKKGESAHRTPHFLPGARAVVFTIAGLPSAQIAVLDLKKGSYRVVVPDGQDGRYVPTGHLVYLRGGTLFAAPFDAASLTVTGPEAPVVESVATTGPDNAIAEYSFSDRGLLTYIQGVGQGSGTVLEWLDAQGQVQALSDTQLWGTGRLSPDGRRIANTINAGAGAASAGDIWVFEVERRTRQRLTFGGQNQNPIWTPDGRRITFGATVSGKSGLYSVMADGSAKAELLLATDSPPTPTSWSPDGKTLLYVQSAAGKPSRLWVLPLSGGAGKPAPLHDTEANETDGQISPDGKWVAYVSTESGQQEIYVQPFPGPGGKERISTQGGNSVRWSHSGRELLYLTRSPDRAAMSVDIQTAPVLHVGLPREISKRPFGTTWDPAPDGKRFLIEEPPGAQQFSRVMVGVSDWFEELRARVPLKR